MRILTLLIFAWVLQGLLIGAENATVTALGAVKLLPKADASRIARIEAREGTPAPDRWYVIVHDPSDEAGVHEFAIAGREIVASRSISQFVETVRPEDAFDAGAIRIDSDRAAKLMKEYARANNVTITRINYELKKDGAEASPIWKLSCVDESGNGVAELTLTATKGTVISHTGFAAAPTPPAERAKKKKFVVYSEPQTGKQSPSEVRDVQSPPEEPVANRVTEPLRKVGNSMKKFFTGHD